jgi:hypothetical protein
MDEHDTKQIVEAAQATFELKIVERLRKTEEDLTNRVRTVESKLQTLQQIAWVIATLAVIFGVTGAWGWKLLLEAKTELDATGRRVAELSTNVNKLEPVLQKARTEQLKQFREDARREADAALAGLQSSIALSNELQTRSLKIVNAEGRTLISLAAGPAGGLLEIFSTTSGKRITGVGASSYGNGELWLSDKSGRASLLGSASEDGGHLYIYNPETEKISANLGVLSGNGELWLFDKSGNLIQR